MDNTFNFPKAPHFSTAASTSRRSFIRYLTVGAAALAVEGCGGGGGGNSAGAPIAQSPPVMTPPTATAPVPPVPPAPPQEPVPVWLPIPALVFTQGIPSSISIAAYVSAANANAFNLSLNATPLPSGVTFNSATLAFDYNGHGTMVTSTGHILTAASA